ncbi:MAG TPA: type II toxin-antitoxin system VapC family toxin [Vicinamibacteria bacterium]|nr:type II toxin-antitoxin system VapC family toxin [Vicinamibacteria bacterium]
MNLSYLLDTNVLSEPVKPTPNPGVQRKLAENEECVAIASLVWHELLFGCYRLPASHRRTMLERYLRDVIAPHVPVLGYDDAAAAWHASERARLETDGKPPSFVDGQIAAIARVNTLVLVTANVSHYECFEGLTIEDWRSD